ncbi:tripartite tricarboxylate transporter substrate binding protein [Pigmentiphaga sp. GD03639]|uniref:tripartite tricarboxylate transporter substrate binding protein n=1 Tax=unclassified Pigmentiphaga TaxID=2626614 RepID=UPI00244940A0|nr:tripartite tricarboxylate transporter substrate binding protein [Pigmentiphaga sp. GD03639]MDH2238707.1 tripartite tricarboxylate transporter substrate binding protein [Pigmentiphaga sp. GD03639]
MFRKCLAIAALALAATGAHAQAYPAKPIRLLIPFPPGGGTDILSRLVATRLGESEKWTIVAENRAGAGGTIGIAAAVRAAPTGYEMVMGQKDNLVVAPWLYKSVAYDPTKDLVAVAHVGYTPIVIVTQANSRFKTLADVVAAAKAAPGSITYGSPGSGTTIHLAGEIFKDAAKIDIRHIPYKGSNAAMMDVLAGNVDLLVSSVPSAMAQIQTGKLRALAVTSAKRSTSLPDVPTVAELGYKGFDVSTWYGLFMPAGTPREIVATMNTAVNKLLAQPETREAIHAQGAEAQAMSTEEFAQLLKTDYLKWKDIVRAANVTVE